MKQLVPQPLTRAQQAVQSYKDKLRQANYIISQRHIRPINIVEIEVKRIPIQCPEYLKTI